MAWNWSHTVEALETARSRLSELSDEVVVSIMAEWACSKKDKDTGQWSFDYEGYTEYYKKYITMEREFVEEAIWMMAEQEQTCTVGGHRAWMCPHGCDPHMVPFS